MTLPHLAAHGTAILLVPVTDETMLECLEARCGHEYDSECRTLWSHHQPHATGDVIVIGDQQATVVEVLPPVRVDQLTAEEIEASGVAERPELTATTWVWRETIKAATAAEREEPNER